MFVCWSSNGTRESAQRQTPVPGRPPPTTRGDGRPFWRSSFPELIKVQAAVLCRAAAVTLTSCCCVFFPACHSLNSPRLVVHALAGRVLMPPAPEWDGSSRSLLVNPLPLLLRLVPGRCSLSIRGVNDYPKQRHVRWNTPE